MNNLLFEQNPIPMLIYELDSLKILEANRSALRQYRYGREEFLTLSLEELRPEEAIPELHKQLRNLREEGINNTGIHRHQNKDGEVFFVRINSQPISYKGKEARLVSAQNVSDQVEAKLQAKKAFEELNHHITESPLAMIRWDRDFCIQEWSDRAREISGYSKNEVLGKSPFSFRFFNEDEASKVKNKIQKLIEGASDRNRFETSILDKKGDLVHIKIYSSALRDEGGKLISVLTLIEDISEQKKSELKYRRLFENAKDGIFLMKNGLFVDCNREVEKLFGYDKENIVGKTPFDFSPELQPDGSLSKEKGQKYLDEALKGHPQSFRWVHQNASGEPISTEVSLNMLDMNDEVYIQAIVRDLTESEQMKKNSKAKEELFFNLFLKSPAAMAMVDKNNEVLIVNEGFTNLFGYTQEEIKGRDIDRLIVPDEEYGEAPKMPAYDYDPEIYNREAIRLTKQGDKKHVLISGIPVYVNDQPYAGIGMYIDITERREYEDKLEESLQEKQVLLQEIHHRVKNNLAVVSSILQLQEFESEDPSTRAVLNDSQMRIKSIALIHEMLYEAKSFSSISFSSYIRQLVGRIQDTMNLNDQGIQIDLEVDEISLNLNQAVPCALLLNELLTNAFKHAFAGEEGGNISVTIVEQNESITVKVSDDGVGLPEKIINTDQSSIGMNLIHTLAEQIGADLELSSKGGTTVSFNFEKRSKTGSSSLYLN